MTQRRGEKRESARPERADYAASTDRMCWATADTAKAEETTALFDASRIPSAPRAFEAMRRESRRGSAGPSQGVSHC